MRKEIDTAVIISPEGVPLALIETKLFNGSNVRYKIYTEAAGPKLMKRDTWGRVSRNKSLRRKGLNLAIAGDRRHEFIIK